MAKMPTMDEWAEKIGNKVLNEYVYNGKTLKEWIDLIASGKLVMIPDNAKNGDVLKALFDKRGYTSLQARMEHTMWWNSPYKAGDTE